MRLSEGFKSKYAPTWSTGNAREIIAASWLELMGIFVKPTGHGTLSSDLLPGYHRDAMSKFDFFCPALSCFFEVTGTDWRKKDSAKRYPNPIIPVLKAKVDAAEYYGVEKHLWFVAVAEMQGEVRFLPCPRAKEFPLGQYAKGEGAYYMVPWDSWLTPARALEKLARRLMR
ncbi:MAG: nuclease [Candidatus Methanosuratincola petrocarbonis]